VADKTGVGLLSTPVNNFPLDKTSNLLLPQREHRSGARPACEGDHPRAWDILGDVCAWRGEVARREGRGVVSAGWMQPRPDPRGTTFVPLVSGWETRDRAAANRCRISRFMVPEIWVCPLYVAQPAPWSARNCLLLVATGRIQQNFDTFQSSLGVHVYRVEGYKIASIRYILQSCFWRACGSAHGACCALTLIIRAGRGGVSPRRDIKQIDSR